MIVTLAIVVVALAIGLASAADLVLVLAPDRILVPEVDPDLNLVDDLHIVAVITDDAPPPIPACPTTHALAAAQSARNATVATTAHLQVALLHPSTLRNAIDPMNSDQLKP